MAGGLGELFIELGVIGDTKELEKFQNKLDETVKAAEEAVKTCQEEIEYNDRLLEITEKLSEATQDLNNAKTEETRTAAQATKAAAEEQLAHLEELKVKRQAARAAREAANANKKEIENKKNFNSQIVSGAKKLIGFITVVIGAVYAINKLTDSLTTNNQTWVNFTRQTDLGLKTLQKYAYVAGVIDKSLGPEGAAGTIADLNQRLFEMNLTGQGAEGFLIAGINPIGKDADEVLEQIRERIKSMNNTAATYLLKQMGIDPKMLGMLRLTRQEFEALNEEMKRYQLTPEQREQIDKMNRQLQIAALKLKYLREIGILKLMPYWVKFIESLARVATGLKHTVDWLTKTSTGVIVLAGVLRTVLIPTILLLFRAIASHPIIATITAIIAALYLLADDIVGYFEGKNSGIGYIINALEDIENGMDSIDTPKWLKETAKILLGIKNTLEGIDKLWEKMTTPSLVPESVIKHGEEARARREAKKAAKNGQTTGGASNIELADDVAAGYAGALPDLSNSFVSPEVERSINNSYVTNNNDNRTINQNNTIYSNQPAFDIQRELVFTNFVFSN